MSFEGGATFFSQGRVIPVLTPGSVESGVTVSRLLFDAGLKMQEIALRTASALDTITTLRKELPDLIIGAGSVLTLELAESALRAGARFLVSPGTTDPLLTFATRCEAPFLPGVATLSEMMRAQDLGCEVAKLFPAEALGGTRFLRTISGPLPAMKFCPTGGIDARLAKEYLQLNNVLAVGGSWMAPVELIDHNRHSEISELAAYASRLA